VCVHRWRLSILVSLPTWMRLAEDIGPPVAILVPSFDATTDIITLPRAGVSELGDAGFSLFSRKTRPRLSVV